ncbi:MAG: hypothetical protein J6N70_03330 [Oribacterium sp.]|nr:hypothetical protein [Oribacterium sp.]
MKRKSIIMMMVGFLTVLLFMNTNVYAASIDFLDYDVDYQSFKTELQNWLDEYNSNSVISVEGNIELLQPFYLVEYSAYDNKLVQVKKDYTVNIPVVCNGKVIALVGTYSFDRIRKPNKIYPISQNIGAYTDKGISFFRFTGSNRDGDYFGGSYEFDFFALDSNDNIHLAFFEVNSRNANSNQRIAAENTRTNPVNIPEYRSVSKLNHIDSDTEAVYSFDYSFTGKSGFTDGSKVYLRNRNGKYLSYTDGKYSMTKTATNSFVLTDNDDGTFSISPEENTEKKMSVNGTKSFFINLSYNDGYTYSISKSDDPSSYMRAKDKAVTFYTISQEVIWNAAFDWYIEKAI